MWWWCSYLASDYIRCQDGKWMIDGEEGKTEPHFWLHIKLHIEALTLIKSEHFKLMWEMENKAVSSPVHLLLSPLYVGHQDRINGQRSNTVSINFLKNPSYQSTPKPANSQYSIDKPSAAYVFILLLTQTALHVLCISNLLIDSNICAWNSSSANFFTFGNVVLECYAKWSWHEQYHIPPNGSS